MCEKPTPLGVRWIAQDNIVVLTYKLLKRLEMGVILSLIDW